MQFYARVLGGEPLFDRGRVGVARLLPCRNLAAERLPVGDAPGQALTAQHADSALGDVQPGAVFRRAVNFETVADPAGLVRRESVVKAPWLMRVKVVHGWHDLFAGEVNVGDVPEESGEIFPRPAVGDLDMHWSESGACTMNRFAVPLRSYSQSKRAGRPGAVGKAVRISFVCCLVASAVYAGTSSSLNFR